MPRTYAAGGCRQLTSRLVIVTEDELVDLMTSLEEGVALHDKAPAFEAEARRLPVGEHGRAQLLAAAGEHWQMRGEYDEAAAATRTRGSTAARPSSTSGPT